MSYIIAGILLGGTMIYILIDAFSMRKPKKKKTKKQNNIIQYKPKNYIDSCWNEIEKTKGGSNQN